MSLLLESYKILDDYKSRRLFHSSLAISQILGVISLLCVITWMGGGDNGGYSWNDDPEREFHYHPTFMAIGPIFLMGEAILVYRTFRREPKRFVKLLHMSILSLVFIFGIIGLKAAWDSHDYHRDPDGELSPLPNLYSLHSWMGIFVFTSFCLQFLGGCTTFFFPGLPVETRKFFLPFHQLFGILLMIGFTVAALIGISERAAWKHKCWTVDKVLCGQQLIANIFGISIIGYTASVVFIILNPRWKRINAPEEEAIQLTHGEDF